MHYTLIFQAFVFMQLFNQINARLLEEGEFNVFAGIFKNPLFSIIVILTFVIQMAMVEVGGRFVKTSSLTMQQNIICIAMGAGELFWGVFIKFLPLGPFQLW